MDNQIFEFRERLKNKLSPARYEHSLSVSYTCISLAMKYGGSLEQAEMAGLLHDCAKRYDDETIVKHCARHQIPVTDDELKAPAVLHAKYGAWMAANQFHVPDDAIISAIACHTTGKPDMRLLDKILYVADYIEPRRYKVENLNVLRQMAYDNLDDAMYRIMVGTLAYLEKRGTFIDPMSREAYHYYKNLREHTKGD